MFTQETLHFLTKTFAFLQETLRSLKKLSVFLRNFVFIHKTFVFAQQMLRLLFTKYFALARETFAFFWKTKLLRSLTKQKHSPVKVLFTKETLRLITKIFAFLQETLRLLKKLSNSFEKQNFCIPSVFPQEMLSSHKNFCVPPRKFAFAQNFSIPSKNFAFTQKMFVFLLRNLAFA